MKTLTFFIFVLIMTVPIMAGSGFEDSGEDSWDVPDQISDFYDQYNFIGSFSTNAERQLILGDISERLSPGKRSGERLSRVEHLMRKVLSRIFVTDPDIIKPVPGGEPNQTSIFRSEILEIKAIKKAGLTAEVVLDSYPLQKSMNREFISCYEVGEIYSLNERLKKAAALLPCGREVHRWVQKKNMWMRSEIRLIYLKLKK
ncbi:hypothetical protein ACFLT9_06385 [Acidobacteriota bacterium]